MRITQVIGIFDYVALVSKDASLVGVFRKNGFRPEQFWSIRVTLERAAYCARVKEAMGANYKPVLGAWAPNETSVAGKNVALAEAHLAEFTAIGIGLPQVPW